jgi:hypothetical protein
MTLFLYIDEVYIRMDMEHLCFPDTLVDESDIFFPIKRTAFVLKIFKLELIILLYELLNGLFLLGAKIRKKQ